MTHDIIVKENPFCTRRIRPGALPYLFAPGQNAKLLVGHLQENHWWGEIIGPHGSGKSSLLSAIIPAIEQTGKTTLLIELHDGQRQLPLDLANDCRLVPPVVVIVDGYEQLSRWNRGRLKRCCRSRGLGLLVTAHRSVGLPQIFQTMPSVNLAEQIVEQLLGNRESPIDTDSIRQCYARHSGNLREMLFDLYDLYQQR